MKKYNSVDPVRSGSKDSHKKNNLKVNYFSPASNGVDEYINDAPAEVKEKLSQLRKLIKEVAPEAVEGMGYGMPGYKLNGPLVYFAAFKNHISFFPTSSQIDQSIKELAKYRTGKGTFQFPLNQPLPIPLIKKSVELRLKENLAKPKKK